MSSEADHMIAGKPSSQEFAPFVKPIVNEPLMIGRSAIMEATRAMALRVAAGDAKVLITGESGVGKDLLARFIHVRSRRASRSFIPINCAGVAETLLESELFGHTRGSFTGAYRDTIGKLQLADGGTVFLDEIGEMSLRMQALLLRFLENGEIHPVGSDAACRRVDVRVIAATNRDLASMVHARMFREDLLYRINVVPLRLPPLRERREDIRLLIEHALDLRGRPLTIDDEAYQCLEHYKWPGNVRELLNIVDQLVCLTTGGVVTARELPPAVRAPLENSARTRGEQRRAVADDLFDGLVSGRYTFWEDVYRYFLNRDMTREDLRQLLHRGLETTTGSYRALVPLFGMRLEDYKRFLNFLNAHGCVIDYRPFRSQAPNLPMLPSSPADSAGSAV